VITPFTHAYREMQEDFEVAFSDIKRPIFKAMIPFGAATMAANARNVAFLQRIKEIFK